MNEVFQHHPTQPNDKAQGSNRPALRFTDLATDRFTAKAWMTPENTLQPLRTLHCEFFANPEFASKYGVPFKDEITTRLAALRAGFVRLNYQVNGGCLTVESMRWNEALRGLIDSLVADNADALDQVRLNILNKDGLLIRHALAYPMPLRFDGLSVSSSLGDWSYGPEVQL